MKKILLGSIVIAAAACGPKGGGGTTTPGADDTDVGTVALQNSSDYDIYSIQLSPYDQPNWGPNLIEGDALLHGEAAKLAVFDCKKYDLRMVDDENVECVIQDIDLCFEDKSWTIDNTVLAVCATGWAD